MTFRFDHVGLLSESGELASTVLRRALGCDLFVRWYNQGAEDLAYLGVATDVLIEVAGPPISTNRQLAAARRGYLIERVAFSVGDVDGAYDNLLAHGAATAWEPFDFAIAGTCVLARAAGVFTPEGHTIELVRPAVDVSRPGGQNTPSPIRLHHVGMCTGDLALCMEFMMKHFGLQIVTDCRRRGRGLVWLADQFWHPGRHDFVLEVRSNSSWDGDDPTRWRARAAGFDHVGFVVQDLELAYQQAIEGGLSPVFPPRALGPFGTKTAWVEDHDGVCFELLEAWACRTSPPEAVERCGL